MVAGSHYIGKAGQLAVMSELARRGYNVSIPEIDIGDDVFVLNDATSQLSRVQVKTATGKKLKLHDAYRCQFSLKRKHVLNSKSGTHYVLVGRCAGSWRYLVFKRFILARLIENGLGTKVRGGRQMLTIIFLSRRSAKTSTLPTAQDLSAHAHRWSLWKPLSGGDAN
jgi:hypothetical protein